MLINKITDVIGKTPIIKIDPKIHGLSNIELYAKLEYLNPFGSLKDRTAYGMLQDSIDDIKNSKMSVIETSSGNTAKALQCICSINGIDFITVTNRIKVSESKNILKFLGTNVIEVSKDVNAVERIEKEMQDCRFFSRGNYDFIEDVGVESANIYMKKLCREMGILAGVSSGAALAAAVKFLGNIDKTLNEKKKAVFIVCDRLEIYANFIKENRFYKYHVLGNTYIVIDPRENPIDLTRQRIADICNREFGIGADGIIQGRS